MKTIGIDFDDILLNFSDAFIVFHNSRYGTTHKREDITSFYLEEVWGVSFEEIHKRLHEFYRSEEHKNASPIIGSIEAITELAKNNVLHIVTASPEEIKQEIRIWLGKHYPDVFKDIHYTRKSLFDKSSRKKAEICAEQGIEVFIDDSLHNAADLSSNGIPVFLLDTSWNKGEVNPLVTRVYSWDEILKRF
jgi:uncharacterized protein